LRETNHIVHVHEKGVEGSAHCRVAVCLAQDRIRAIAQCGISYEADHGLDQRLQQLEAVGTGASFGLGVVADEASAATPELVDEVLFICSTTDPLELVIGITHVFHNALASQEDLGRVADWSRQAERGA
jgi:hypothetical protein